VPFREFKSDSFKLAKETLQEIPGQLVDFFTKRNIFPKPAKEEQRNAIVSKLSLKSKVDPNKQLDRYQEGRKQKLIEDCAQMGFDHFEVQDLIEEKGIWENSMDLLLAAKN